MSQARSKKSSGPRRKQPGTRLLKLFTACFLLLFALAIGRLFTVQILRAKTLTQQAENQRTAEVVTPAQRGTIYDRQGNVLAKSVQVYNISVDPTVIGPKHTVARRLAQAFGGTEETYYTLLLRKTHYALLAKGVDPSAVTTFQKSANFASDDSTQTRSVKRSLQSLSFALDYKRVYPAGTVASQVVGFVNAEGKGVAGIEMQYNDVLQGTQGVSFSERDQAGNPIPAGIQKTITPKPGHDIILTIDSQISYYAQLKLDETVASHEATTGAVVVMDPRSGEVYAACSSPTFDPNDLKNTTNAAIRNRALVDLYEPGSTFKTLTLAGGLQGGYVTPTTSFSVPDNIQIGDHVVRDADPHPTGPMTVAQIIQRSSNVGATRIANTMGVDAFYQTLIDFGLTKDPGIDFPGSAKGYLAPKNSWSKLLLSNASFGQGVSLTPVSLCRCVSAVANGGTLITPHFLADVPSAPGLLPDWKSKGKRILDQNICKEETQILEGVVNQSGTGSTVHIPDYVVAGKSGTGQIAEPGKGYATDKYASSFVGYLPADDPQVLCLVVIFEPQKGGYYGAAVSGPTFADIISYAATQLKIPPTGNGGQNTPSGGAEVPDHD